MMGYPTRRGLVVSLSMLLLSLLAPKEAAAQSLTILDAMKLAQERINPACANALKVLDAKTAAKADLASGKVVESFKALISQGGNAAKIVVDGIPTTLGSPDLCNVKALHYCQIGIHENFIRWGACLPSECSGDDLLHALFPPGFEKVAATMTTQCLAPDYHDPTTGTYVMMAITFTLVALALLGTWIDHSQQQTLPVARVAQAEEETKTEPVKGQKEVAVDIIGEAAPSSSPRTEPSVASAIARHLKSFSLIRNMKSLLSPARGGAFDCFDGLRVFSICWVVLGHSLSFPSADVGLLNPLDGISLHNSGWVLSFWGLVVRGGFFSVDTFFFMSAFLACFFMLKALRDQIALPKFLKGIPSIYFMRWIRLTPAYAFVIFAFTYFAPAMTDGPFVGQRMYNSVENCKAVWWQNLLYVNNIVNDDIYKTGCYPLGWYLGMDFQLFLLVPFIAALASFHEVLGYLAAASIATASYVVALTTSLDHGWSMNPLDQGSNLYFNEYYVRPWMRAAPTMIGLMAAIVWFYHSEAIHSALKDRPRARLSLLLSSLTLMGLPVFGARGAMAYYPVRWSPELMASFLVFSNSTWVTGVAILCFLLFLDFDGPTRYIKQFLEMQIFTVLSRLTYTAYLVHYWPLALSITTYYSGVHFSNVWLMHQYLGTITATFIFAFGLYILVEKPLANLERSLRGGNKAGKQIASSS